ncbi:MlaD family protein [Paraconexibacter algicola]|uniref:MCE family protein n=1 Tax=Paraconexibacter algicola TaxID=2133960 RepID=A0A2T4UGI9_9ACTN|nr:MlaD family protein [Paraconexibacter algicola]PTL58371.1 MCE family protein [Paraconexibacter algicola]
MNLRQQLRKYSVTILAIFGLLIAAVAVGSYILVNQRLRLPWEDFYSVKVELPTAQAITPGQGQTVTVAGVNVGEIGAVDLVNGRAVVRMDIERNKLDAVHADAKVLVRPRTGLQDMTIDMDPGTPSAPKLGSDDVLPVSRATPTVNVDEVLAGLDGDTRGYVQALVQGLGDGLAGDRALNLREILKTSQPTLARTKELTAALRGRRVELRRLVSRLASLSGRVAGQSDDLQALVSQGNTTFAAIASEDDALRRGLAELPGTLGEVDGALAAARPLARDLKPALTRLEPTARRLRPALQDLASLARTGGPAVRELRGLSREARPTARQTAAAVKALTPVTADLDRSMAVLGRVVNTIAYNPPGKEEGYLFWLAWFGHNTTSMLSTNDGNGVAWRGQVIVSCANVNQAGLLVPLLQPLADLGVCPK